MTRKHYVAMAVSITEAIEAANDDQAVTAALFRIASDFCDMAKADNPRFDRTRFLAACGF